MTEFTEAVYTNRGGGRQTHTGPFYAVPGGVVLQFSQKSQTFIPHHRIVEITQTFAGDIEAHEMLNKSLYRKMNRAGS